MFTNPEEVTFFVGFDVARFFDDVALTDIGSQSGVTHAMYESAVFANWNQNRSMLFSPSEMEPRLITPEVVTGSDVASDRADQAMQYTIAEDAKWSDGVDVKAGDAAVENLYQTHSNDPPYDAFNRGMPRSPRTAWEEIVFPDGKDGKVIQFTDPWGAIDTAGANSFALNNVFRAASASAAVSDGLLPSHKEPYSTALDVGLERIAEVVKNPDKDLGTREDFVNAIGLSADDLKKGRDPDWVVTTGAWTLSEIRGAQEVVLEPNPHWRGEKPNFETIRFVFNDSSERRTSSLISGNLDHLPESLPAEVWQNVPDKYETQKFGIGDAGGIGMDHSDPHLGNRSVRAALYRALNVEPIANSIHPELATGIHTPGAQTPGVMGVGNITEDWLDSNLIDYSHDPEGAAQMLRDEGYSKQGGVWVGPEGEELSYELPTPNSATESGSMSMVQGVAQQWSNFGIPVSVRTMDTSTWQDQFEAAKFSMWPGGSDPFGGFDMGGTWRVSHEIFKLSRATKIVAWGMHPEEKLKQQKYLGEDLEGWKGQGYAQSNNDILDDFTVDIPPIGEPEGERSPYPLYAAHNIPRLNKTPKEWGKMEKMWKQRFWYYNWHLPWIPVYRTQNQVWWNDADWDFSRAKDHFMWEFWGDTWKMADLIANSMFDAQT
jgi:ABC-type transport system substrate-binding protein